MKTGAISATPLERSVLVQMARGYKTKQIAAALGLSPDRVSQARRRVLNRNGVANDTQLGMLIERCQLVSADERNRIEDRREERMVQNFLDAR